NNRAHRHMAGNAYFDGLNLDIPKAQHNPYNPKNIEYLKIKIDKRMKQLEQGFKILAENYFGAFDEGGNPLGQMYEEHTKADITPIVSHINTESFIMQNQYYREGLRLPLFEKMEAPGKVRLRSFYESKGLVYVKEWKKDYEFEKKYGQWHEYAINTDGFIEYKKRNDQSYDESHKVGGKVLALLWFKQDRETSPKSELARAYENRENTPFASVDEQYKAQRAYEDYLVQYWQCFSVYLLDETTDLRPNDSAYRDWHYWKYEAVTGFDNRRQSYYNTIIQVRSWDQVFFNSIVEQDVKLNEVEVNKQNTFKSFVRAKLVEQERAIFSQD
ncbi:hypothetical protein, partial [Helicobacter suis]|uniref:hypothetical protein n=1 Tax=Helicobacter suis TaxID=104628 RepID=UPI00196772B1